MKLLQRILGLEAQQKELKKKLANQKNTGVDTSKTQLDISVNKILQYSAKTNPKNK